MGEHSKLGASSMYRWEACPGSVKLCEGIESVSSPYAEEGTLSHEYAAEAVKSGFIPKDIESEQFEAVELYRDTVFQDRLEFETHVVQELIEHKFDLSALYPKCFGTADYVRYIPGAKFLVVYDYKYGAGIPVEVKGNSQLMYYGLGALLSLNVQCEFIELVIVQPRCPHPDGPVRRHRISFIEILDFAGRLIEAAKRTERPDAPLNPGGHCRFCPAAGICPALQAKSLEVAKQDFTDVSTKYDPSKLAEALHWLSSIESWVKSVREFAYNEAIAGRVPPGFKLVDKRATRHWRDGVDESVLMGEFLLEPEQLVDLKLKSPAQVEKLLTKEQKNYLSEFTVSHSSGCTLVPDTDSRKPSRSDPKDEFTVIDVTNSIH